MQDQRIASMPSEQVANIVLHNSGDYAIIVTDLSGIIVHWNPSAEKVLGWTAAQAIGQSAAIFFTLEDREAGRLATEMQHAALHGTAMDERWHLKRDGSHFWASGQMTSLHEDGVLIGYSKILRDRTRERQTEERLRIAQYAGGIGSFELFPESGKILPSEQFCRLWGIPVQEEFDVTEFIDLIHPDDRGNVVTGNRTLPENALEYTEYRILRPDTGEMRWMARRGELMKNEIAGRPRYIGVSYDITQRKRTELDLRFLAQVSVELSKLVDPQSTLDKLAFLAVPIFADWCAIDLLEEDGSLSRVSVAHVDPTKVELAHDLHRQFPPDPTMQRGTWNVLRTGQPELVSDITDELLGRLIQDQDRLAAYRQLGFRSYIGVPLTTQGKILGVVTFISSESARLYNQDDIALAEDLARRAAIAIENANLYKALQEADRGKDVFLATLAHELRNPLAAIVNGLSIMKLAADNRQKVEQSTEVMERQADQLTRLVNDLMDISRINTGKIELKREHTNLASVVNSAIETARPYIEGAGHNLSVKLPGEPTNLFADAVRLSQVFSNLLSNAAKYTNPGGKIEIVVECLSCDFVVRVKDTGMGIPTDMLKHIFTIFTQVSHPLERSQGGLGIGLSLVEGLVRLHGGRIEVFSKGLGQGSEFVVHLPKTAIPVLSAEEGESTESPHEKKTQRILVVDDNKDAAGTIAEILLMLGHEVTTIHDGLSAVTVVTELKPDIVLLDIGLPGIDGFEAARRIREAEETRGIVLIALTGWGQEQDKQRSTQAGFDEHWVKPVKLEQLNHLARMRRKGT